MEKQIERLLTVLMKTLNDGLGDGKGGWLEEPVAVAAHKVLAESKGEVDAAVAAAAHDMLVRRSDRLSTVWRSAMMLMVGNVPLVGSAAAVFYSQFESVWKQVRFVAMAATLYGHDCREDAVQCQIVLCLLDDKVRKRDGGSAMDEIYGKSLRSGVAVAATIVARHVVVANTTGFLVRSVLGGLLCGVVPEAVGSLFVAWAGGLSRGEAEDAARARALKDRAKEYFKKEQQPSLATVRAGFAVWAAHVFVNSGMHAWKVYGDVLERLVLGPAWKVFGLPISGQDAIFEEGPWLHVAVSAMQLLHVLLFCTITSLALVGFLKAALRTIHTRTWLVCSVALGVRAILQFLSAHSTAVSLCLALQALCALVNRDLADGQGEEGFYHLHRALIGLFVLFARVRPSIKHLVPLVVASLLAWTLYYSALLAVDLVSAAQPYSWPSWFQSLFLATRDATSYTTTRSGWLDKARFHEGANTVKTVALHLVIEEIRRPEIIISLVGSKKVVEGLLYAAKSLGHVVASPETVFLWLERTTPPVIISWGLLTAQLSASYLGLAAGMLSYSQLLRNREIALLCYGAQVSISFVLWGQPLPPPRENQVWSEALQSRTRLLYLFPDLDDRTRIKLFFAIDFFETYDLALARSKQVASSPFGKVKDWVATSFAKRDKRAVDAPVAYYRQADADQELDSTVSAPAVLVVDASVYYRAEDGGDDYGYFSGLTRRFSSLMSASSVTGATEEPAGQAQDRGASCSSSSEANLSSLAPLSQRGKVLVGASAAASVAGAVAYGGSSIVGIGALAAVPFAGLGLAGATVVGVSLAGISALRRARAAHDENSRMVGLANQTDDQEDDREADPSNATGPDNGDEAKACNLTTSPVPTDTAVERRPESNQDQATTDPAVKESNARTHALLVAVDSAESRQGTGSENFQRQGVWSFGSLKSPARMFIGTSAAGVAAVGSYSLTGVAVASAPLVVAGTAAAASAAVVLVSATYFRRLWFDPTAATKVEDEADRTCACSQASWPGSPPVESNSALSSCGPSPIALTGASDAQSAGGDDEASGAVDLIEASDAQCAGDDEEPSAVAYMEGTDVPQRITADCGDVAGDADDSFDQQAEIRDVLSDQTSSNESSHAIERHDDFPQTSAEGTSRNLNRLSWRKKLWIGGTSVAGAAVLRTSLFAAAAVAGVPISSAVVAASTAAGLSVVGLACVKRLRGSSTE